MAGWLARQGRSSNNRFRFPLPRRVGVCVYVCVCVWDGSVAHFRAATGWNSAFELRFRYAVNNTSTWKSRMITRLKADWILAKAAGFGFSGRQGRWRRPRRSLQRLALGLLKKTTTPFLRSLSSLKTSSNTNAPSAAFSLAVQSPAGYRFPPSELLSRERQDHSCTLFQRQGINFLRP